MSAFSAFTKLCSHHLCGFKIFSSHSLFYPFLSNHQSAFCVCGFAYSVYFIWKESGNMWPFLSSFFHLVNAFMFHLSCSHYFIPSRDWIIMPCISIPRLVYPFIIIGEYLAATNNVAIHIHVQISIHVQVSMWTRFHFSRVHNE